MKPLLPSYDRLEKYIRRIDEARIYSNFGTLNAEYQERISELFDCPCISGSSATSLITATLMALNLPRGGFVAMPSYTFPATAAAVEAAGLVPYFQDVDAHGVMSSYSKNVCAVVVVAPFGAPFHVEGKCNVPVIIDAAAGFDAFSTIRKPGNTPVIISTHVTKAFGTGEGGLLFTKDTELLEKVRRITNFGLSPDRWIEYTGLNAKFSEYHAAVGLAELDGWQEKRKLILEKVRPYGLDYAVTQIPVRGDGVMGKYGCHIHPTYAKHPRVDLPVTEELIRNVGAVGVEI